MDVLSVVCEYKEMKTPAYRIGDRFYVKEDGLEKFLAEAMSILSWHYEFEGSIARLWFGKKSSSPDFIMKMFVYDNVYYFLPSCFRLIENEK